MIGNILTSMSIYWHFPLMLAVVSLVYSATRYESWGDILHEAWRWGTRMGIFLLGIAVGLYLLALFIG